MADNKKLRLQICRFKTHKSTSVPIIVKPLTVATILKAAHNKRVCGKHHPTTLFLEDGSEIDDKMDLSSLLSDDSLIFVASGKDLVSKHQPSSELPSASLGLPQLPAWPQLPSSTSSTSSNTRPSGCDTSVQHFENDVEPLFMISPEEKADGGVECDRPQKTKKLCSRTMVPGSERYEFEGIFPKLEGNVLPQIREAIHAFESSDDFAQVDCGDYIAFYYKRVTKHTFPDPMGFRKKDKRRWYAAVRRELRGLLVCYYTGVVLARRFHKFFNVNELPETDAEKIEIDPSSAVITEKLDGSLVSPLLLEGTSPSEASSSQPVVHWATKSHLCPAIDQFIDSQSSIIRYRQFALHWLSRHHTPLFEWCEPKHVSVIRHTKQTLTLLVIRHNVNGKYLPREEVEASAAEFGIPIVPTLNFNLDDLPISALVDAISALEDGKEGVVLTSDADGRMFKIKSRWYVALHENAGVHNLEGLLTTRPSLVGVPKDMILSAVLISQKTDDMVALLRSSGNGLDAERLEKFAIEVHRAIQELHMRIVEWAVTVRTRISLVPPDEFETDEDQAARDQVKAKEDEVVKMVVEQHPGWNAKTLLMYLRNDADAQEALQADIRTLASRKQWDELEKLIGIAWSHDEVFRQKEAEGQSGEEDMAQKAKSKTVETKLSETEDREDLKEMELHIYCDLDGVMADFEAHLQCVSGGKKASQMSLNAMWDLVGKQDHFFAELPLMTGARRLWDFLKSSTIPISILTGLPLGALKEIAKLDKIKWVRNHLDPDVDVIACMQHEKCKCSGFGKILIDDREDLKQPWENAGGIFIHHTSAMDTIRRMEPLCRHLVRIQRDWSELIQADLSLIVSTGLLQVNKQSVRHVFGSSEVDSFLEAVAAGPTVVAISVLGKPEDAHQPADELHGRGANAKMIGLAFSEDESIFAIDLSLVNDAVREILVKLFIDEQVLKVMFGTYPVCLLERQKYELNRYLDLQDLVRKYTPTPRAAARTPITTLTHLARLPSLDSLSVLESVEWPHATPMDGLIHASVATAKSISILYHLFNRYPGFVQLFADNILPKEPETIEVAPPATPEEEDEAQRPARPPPKTPASPFYSAVFLSPSSHEDLIRQFTPEYPSITADHVTLQFRPSADEVAALPVGRPVDVKVLFEAKDRYCQAVAAEIPTDLPCKNAHPHLTISTAEGVPAVYSNVLIAAYKEQQLEPDKKAEADFEEEEEGRNVFKGQVGVLIQYRGYARIPFPLTQLSEFVKKRLMEFMENAKPGKRLVFSEKFALDARQRKLIHCFADEQGLEHESTGPKTNRVLTLVIPKKWPRDDDSEDSDSPSSPTQGRLSEQTIFESSQLNSFDFSQPLVPPSGGKPKAESPINGVVSSNGCIRWFTPALEKSMPPNVCLTSEREGNHKVAGKMVIIMRGLAGSGKSSVARTIAHTLNDADPDSCVIVSADFYFENGAGKYNKCDIKKKKQEDPSFDVYKASFDAALIPQAHDFCRTEFEQALKNEKQVIIVDNTHSRIAHYTPYLKAAEEAGYATVILEVAYLTERYVGEFCKRGSHGVTYTIMHKMYQNWEKDPQAVRVLPWFEDVLTFGKTDLGSPC